MIKMTYSLVAHAHFHALISIKKILLSVRCVPKKPFLRRCLKIQALEHPTLDTVRWACLSKEVEIESFRIWLYNISTEMKVRVTIEN